MRVVAFVDDKGVRLSSSNGNDATTAFPELQGLAELLEGFDSLVLDGEAVAFGADGLPSFEALQHRMHVADERTALERAKATPVTFAIFDLLHVNGHDTMALPLVDRRTLLEQIVDDGSHWRLTNQILDDPNLLLETVIDRRIEGIVAKRLDSTYQEGARSRSWIKIKPTRRQEFVVAGWVEGRDGNSGGLGSLLLGVTNVVGGVAELSHCGRVGSGLSDADRRWWTEQLTADSVNDSPFSAPILVAGRTVHWSRPNHVIEVAFSDWTTDGGLRHPVYVGRRNDKDPAEVVRED